MVPSSQAWVTKRVTSEASASGFSISTKCPAPSTTSSVACPSLVVWGRQDRVVPLECGERYTKALGQARLEIVEGAGHFVEMEKPEALASLVTRFVTQA